MREVFLDLPNATISLYPVLAGSTTRSFPWGRADVENPVFMGAEANALRLIKRFEEVVTRPTGRAHPEVRHINEEHEISIQRLWITRTESGTHEDYEIERNEQFVLLVAWQESAPMEIESSAWLARVYYGVKLSTFDLASQDSISFLGEQAIRAEFYRKKSGVGVITI